VHIDHAVVAGWMQFQLSSDRVYHTIVAAHQPLELGQSALLVLNNFWTAVVESDTALQVLIRGKLTCNLHAGAGPEPGRSRARGRASNIIDTTSYISARLRSGASSDA
jgi:hypothetical protein